MGGQFSVDKLARGVGAGSAAGGLIPNAMQSKNKDFMAGYDGNPEIAAKKKKALLDSQVPLTAQQSKQFTGRSTLLG